MPGFSGHLFFGRFAQLDWAFFCEKTLFTTDNREIILFTKQNVVKDVFLEK